MAPMIGREMSERLFLDRFAKLCTDPVFHVRKVCAANFGDFCGVVGPEATEKILVSSFFIAIIFFAIGPHPPTISNILDYTPKRVFNSFIKLALWEF